jgi:transposase InsO family protein
MRALVREKWLSWLIARFYAIAETGGMESSDRPTNCIHSHLDEDQIERIVQKQSVLRDFDNSHLSKAEFARSRGICRTTLFRDISRRKKSGFSGLIDLRKLRPKKGIKLDDRYTEIILTFLVDHPKAPVTAIHAELIKQAAERGWGTPPTYHKVRRFCRAIASDVLRQWTDGRKVRIEEQSLTIRRIVTSVNELWQTDCSELPIWCFDPVVGPELFKPWITGTIDCASRVVPGTFVSKTVSAADVLCCWKKAMCAKGIETWPFYGVPTTVSMDNAKIFKGDAWQSLVSLGVEPFLIGNDSPEQNGKQERWFKTLQTRLISHLVGFADQYRGKEKARKCCIPYPLLQKLIDDFILEYHLTEHSALGMTPWEAWHRGLANARGLLIPTTEIDRCLRVSREVKVSAEGVQVDNRKFTGTCLEGRVGDTLTVRVPPEGPKDSVAVYDHGLLLGDAVEHISTELAQEISTTRLERTIAIDRLAKRIREKNGQMPPTPVPESPAPKTEDAAISVPAALPPVDTASNGNAESLGPIPDLPDADVTPA